MAKKRKGVAADEVDSLVNAVSASAQQIWQAGLGAFAATRLDGGKLFEALVHDGAQLHKLTRELSRGKVPDVAGKVGQLAEDVARQANASWEKIEQYFETRVAGTLHRMGVPSRDDIDRLRQDVTALEAAIRLSAGSRGGTLAISPAAGTRSRKAGQKRTSPDGTSTSTKRAH
ncbi:hypothetical protein GCM10027277_49880 [Pseudoduganella ginsengisoli]|nr:phasin family protein [Pseudoduganella ginsengisoli]